MRRYKNILEVNTDTGGAWLSSVRAVRCLVKSRNERCPCRLVTPYFRDMRHFSDTATDKVEEGEDNVKSSCPLCLGLQTCYNGWYNKLQIREEESISKTSLSSD